MDVIILAGGLGTRLRPVVGELPKCMAPVCGEPFLYYLFSYLHRLPEIKRIILSLGYKHEAVVEWTESLKEFDFEYVYSIEDEPLGTGGAIKKSLIYANEENVLILNGDTFFNIDLNLFLQQHIGCNALLSVALKPMTQFERYGNVEVNEKAVITAFREKQYCKEGQINGGIYLLKTSRNLLESFPDKFSYETAFLQPQAKEGNIYGFTHNDYFIDIGIPEDYAKANAGIKGILIYHDENEKKGTANC
jgi:D-glycero-alpha-D-manno-heptose 1-phosphate guanylyltransferase